ncbi:MAG: energy-coupling factor transporter ATPase [Firmicutes bacterium]|nr:energy-coupling factor transporter ATPase [Bacillota bacterium]
MNNTMVRSEGLSFSYPVYDDEGNKQGVNQVLKNVTLSVQKGEWVAILGHNGSGKSTFARHVNALLFPEEGTLWVNGIDTRSEEQIWEIRSSAGMIFQNPDNQIIASIVEEDVAFGPENLGVEPSEIRSRVDAALSTVNMRKYADRDPNRLSGGQKQRVAIAGVLAMKPACIILDEPTAMLDPSGRREVMDTLERLNHDEHITILHITHYMEEAARADRVIVIDHGEAVLEGTPKEVFAQVDRMKALGLDVPQMTELAYDLRKSGIDIPADITTVEEMVEALCRLKSKT